MTLPRYIHQPGPPPAERILAVEARGRAFSFVMQPGLTLLEAARSGFEAEGFNSGVLVLNELALAPFAYVMPALSETPEHAAFYSAIHRPEGVSRLRYGAMTLGIRDDRPFFHCHALWRERDGALHGGHILPEETIVAEPARVNAIGLDGAVFRGNADPETNFKLFEPFAAPSKGITTGSRVFAMRLRPNQDFAGALEGFCSARGIERARLWGGVGSTIGARFDDGREVANFATEIFLRDGSVTTSSAGVPVADLPIALADYTGAVADGRLVRGDNPVLMTVELVLEVL